LNQDEEEEGEMNEEYLQIWDLRDLEKQLEQSSPGGCPRLTEHQKRLIQQLKQSLAHEEHLRNRHESRAAKDIRRHWRLQRVLLKSLV
jgi:hypothetical protein